MGQGDCAALFLNQIGMGIIIDGENIWEKYSIPVYDFIVDHPRNFGDWLENPLRNIHLIVLDGNHEKYARRVFPEVKDIIVLSDGGNEVDGKVPYLERTIDVIYVGSCQKAIEYYPRIEFFEDGGQDFFQRTISTLVDYPVLATEDVVDLYVEQVAKSLKDDEVRYLHIDCAPFVEATVRRHYKILGMKMLSDVGVVVDIYGKDWDAPVLLESDNIRIHNWICSNDCNRLMGQAKVALNYMPWFKEGSSERVFNAMLNGAVCVTDKSAYLLNNYTDGKDLVFYDLNNTKQMAMDVRWLLEHPGEAAKIAQSGYEVAKTIDTWECRLKTIVCKMGENCQ